MATVLVAASSVFVSWRTGKRADRRDHLRWLQEKRREAYVTFLTATRDAYDSIEKRGQDAEAPRINRDHRRPNSPQLLKDRAEIDVNFGKVKRARDVLAIVGPKEMGDLGDAVLARISLDRIFYSPTGCSQRNDKGRILQYVEATDNKDFLVAMQAAYDAKGRPNFAAYRAAHHEYRLDIFWETFAERSRHFLDEWKPASRFSRGWAWLVSRLGMARTRAVGAPSGDTKNDRF